MHTGRTLFNATQLTDLSVEATPQTLTPSTNDIAAKNIGGDLFDD